MWPRNIVFYGGTNPSDWVIESLTAPTPGVFGEADHTIAMRAFRQQLERARKSYEFRLYRSMPHGWLNDTMPGPVPAPGGGARLDADQGASWTGCTQEATQRTGWDGECPRIMGATTISPRYVGTQTHRVELGEGIKAFLAVPDSGTPPYRAIIVGNERYGLVLDSFDLAARFAAYAYVAIAPDMASNFAGDKVALNKGDIGGGWNNEIVRAFMSRSYDHLTTLPEVDVGCISAIGFCAGGPWARLLNGVWNPAGCVLSFG